jgi:hypothetical protein
MTRYQRPTLSCLRTLQAHSTRGWVYRQKQGWVFDTLTPDELAEFKSYGERAPHIARVRFPHGPVVRTFSEFRWLGNQFAYCTLMRVHDVALARFQIHKVDEQRTSHLFQYTLEADSYEAWLWADEVAICRELGCEVTVRDGWGWEEWGPPATTPPRAWYKEHTFIYALADPFTQEVCYVGKSDNPQRRLIEHLKDTANPDKAKWICGLDELGYKPKLLILEEVSGEDAPAREYFWTLYYWDQGHKLTNSICWWWNELPEKPGNRSFWHKQHARLQREKGSGSE